MRLGHLRTPVGVRIGAPLILGAILVAVWQALATSGRIAATLLPRPGAVVTRLIADVSTGNLLTYTGVTLVEAVLGSMLAAALALPLGYLIARVRTLEAATSPYLAASQAIPAIAVAPLLVLWVGYGLFPVVLLCAVLVFFPIVLSTRLGIRTLDESIVEAAALDGAAGWSMLRWIELPLARPAILTGLRNGFTVSVTGAVVGEFVMGGKGLGMVISVTSGANDITGLFAALVVLCLMAVAIYFGLLALEVAFDPMNTAGDLPAGPPVLSEGRQPAGPAVKRQESELAP